MFLSTFHIFLNKKIIMEDLFNQFQNVQWLNFFFFFFWKQLILNWEVVVLLSPPIPGVVRRVPIFKGVRVSMESLLLFIFLNTKNMFTTSTIWELILEERKRGRDETPNWSIYNSIREKRKRRKCVQTKKHGGTMSWRGGRWSLSFWNDAKGFNL